MAENVAVTTLEIKGTEQVATSMKELREQIKSYKDELVVLGQIEEKTEQQKAQQTAVVEKLTKATKLLSDVTSAHRTGMGETEKKLDILNDSYNDLQAQLTKLKKAYKDMSAAERDSDIGAETLQNIKQLDVKLKDLDAGMGQFQRNVGNYGKTFEESMANARQNTGFLEQGMGTLMAVMGLAGAENKALLTTIAGLQLAFQAFNNEGVQKVIISIKNWIASKVAARAAAKAQAAEVKAETVAVTANATATKAATTATNGFKKALMATGIGAIVVALGALIANWDKVVELLNSASGGQGKMNKAMAEGAAEAAKEVVELKVLEAITTDVTRAEEERNKAASILLERLGETADATSIAAAKNGEYANSVLAVSDALVKQARAEAALEMIREKQAEILTKKTKVNQDRASGPNLWDYMAAALADNREFTAETYREGRVERQDNRIEKLEEEFNTWLDNLMKNFSFEDFDFGGSTDNGATTSSTTSSTTTTKVATTPTSGGSPIPSEEDIDAALEAEEKAILEAIAAQEAFAQWKADREQEARDAKFDALHEEVVAYGEAEMEKRKQSEETAELEKKMLEEKRARTMESINLTTTGLSSLGAMFNAISSAVEATSADEEDALKKTKGIKIAGATMDMLSGVVSAISTAMTIPPPAGPIIGAVNAATVLATGAANIAQIKAVDVSGASSTTPTPSASVAAPTINRSLPATQILTSASDEERLNKMASDQRVKLVYSDIEIASTDQRVKVEESSF